MSKNPPTAGETTTPSPKVRRVFQYYSFFKLRAIHLRVIAFMRTSNRQC